MDPYQFNFSNMDEAKSIFTTASDSQATITKPTDSFESTDIKSSVNTQGSVFSPLAAPFQSRMTDNLLSFVTPQEPRPADTAPPTSDIDDVLLNTYISNSESGFEHPMEPTSRSYLMGSRAEPAASAPANTWAESSNPKSDDVHDFDFFLKTLYSAHTYASLLSREQLSVIQSIRPSLLYEFLREVVRIRTDKRLQRALPHECAFCKNNGENEEHYSSHALKDWRGRVQCPVLRAFRCPRCGATGDRAHTIKYCPANDGLDRSGHLLRRRFSSSSSYVMNDASRLAGYTAPPTPSPSVSSGLNSSMWSNFGMN